MQRPAALPEQALPWQPGQELCLDWVVTVAAVIVVAVEPAVEAAWAAGTAIIQALQTHPAKRSTFAYQRRVHFAGFYIRPFVYFCRFAPNRFCDSTCPFNYSALQQAARRARASRLPFISVASLQTALRFFLSL